MKKLPVLPVFCMALLLFAVQAHAAPLDSSGLLDNILQKFDDAASHWQGKVISYASWLFWVLALLSMTWTFGMMALKNAGITEALAEIIRFFAVTGFFWWLLLNGPAISTSIIDSLRKISAEASGLGNNLSPSGIVDIGFDIASKVVDQSSMWSPVNSGIGLIVAGVIQLTAYYRWQSLMNAQNFAHEPHHLLGESATHPIGQHCGALAALLRLAGTSPPRCLALPAHRSAAHSGASNCSF